MRTVFVTGGSSPLGERLVPHLVENGFFVICLARSSEAAGRITEAGGAVIRGSIENTDAWAKRAASADHIVHLAGIYFARQVLAGVPPGLSMVAVSSASATHPHQPRAQEVARCEAVLRQGRAHAVILRPTMIYGTPRDRNLRYLSLLLRRLPAVPRFAGGGLLQPVHVDDVVAAITHHLNTNEGACLEVGGPDQVIVGELVDRIATELRLRRVGLRVPVAALAGIVQGAGLESRHRALHAVAMLGYARVVPIPNKALLGRSPTTLDEGLPRALAAYGLSPRSPRRSRRVWIPR